MRRLLGIGVALLVAGCGSDGKHHDIVGPFTGQTFRFVVDHLTLPQKRSEFAVDLDGDAKVDNQLGNVVAVLAELGGYVTAPDDQTAAGSLTWSLEITTDDASLMNDSTVGVRFFSRDGEPSDELGGSLVDGVLHTNPTPMLQHPATGTLRLPLLPDVDAIRLDAIGLEIDLHRDGSGFAGTVAGALPSPGYLALAAAAINQMIDVRPSNYGYLWQQMDADRDGSISGAEIGSNDWFGGVVAPDVRLTDGMANFAPDWSAREKDSFSVGIGIHLAPCASGTCASMAVKNRCDDRAVDGAESDVDCGAACNLGCGGGLRCVVDADCLAGRCLQGKCAVIGCSDGVRDGFESDVDCGQNCPPCADGRACFGGADCLSHGCTNGSLQAEGKCVEPHCSDAMLDGDETGIDCGGSCAPCGAPCSSDMDCGLLGHCVFGHCR